jgi:hypothetical protein
VSDHGGWGHALAGHSPYLRCYKRQATGKDIEPQLRTLTCQMSSHPNRHAILRRDTGVRSAPSIGISNDIQQEK